MALQIRRGTNAERLGIIPLQGELLFTTDTKKLYVGDGTTLGGIAADTLGEGGGITELALNELTDVNISSLVTGQVLKWDGTAWINGTDLNDGTGSLDLEDLTNVNITGLSIGQVLAWDGTNWVNTTDQDVITDTLEDLIDVNINLDTLVTGQVLKFDGTIWSNAEDSSAVSSLEDITDVSLNNPVTGQGLIWNGSNWVNDVISVGLEDLTNVAVNTPVTGQVLKWDGTNWTNSTDEGGTEINSLSDVQDVTIADIAQNQILKWDGTVWVNSNNGLENITGVSISLPSAGDVLTFNGVDWVNLPDPEPSVFIEDLLDVNINTPITGDILSWDGVSWSNIASNFVESFTDLIDVNIDAPTVGDVIKWDGTTWTNSSEDNISTIALLTDVTISDPTTGQVLKWQGEGWVNDVIELSDITDIVVTSADLGDVLQYNGTFWTNEPITLSGEYYISIVDEAGLEVLNTDLSTLDIETITTTTVLPTGNILNFGSAISPASFNFFQSDSVNFNSVGDSWLEINSSNGTLEVPTAVTAGTPASGLILNAYDGTSYSNIATYTARRSTAPGSNGDAIIIARSSTNAPVQFFFTGNGVSSAPAFRSIGYANATARNAVLTAPSAGTMVYLQDQSRMTVYVADTGLATGGAANTTPGWVFINGSLT